MRIQLVLAFLLGFSAFLYAQQSPAPAARQSKESPGEKPDVQTEQADDIVRITTNLVQVDAVVTTKDGKPVTDLRAEDFELLQDGRLQTITHFSYISNVPATASTSSNVAATPKQKERGVIPSPTTAVTPRPHDARRTVALVIDDLGVSFESMAVLRDQMRKFLDEQLQPNDLVAIIRTGGEVGALQQFTTDRRLLYSALEHMKWNPCGRAGFGFASAMEGLKCGPSLQALRVTFHRLRFILQGMRDLPGRKSMVIFTDDLPTLQQEDGPLTNPYAGLRQDYPGLSPNSIDYDRSIADPGNATSAELDNSISLVASLDRIVELAIRGSVVIYAVDTRGLQYTGATAADQIKARAPDKPASPTSDPYYDTQGKLNLEQMGTTIMGKRAFALREGRAGAEVISSRTGGFMIFNSNDFGFRRIMNDQQGYYLIGYRPSEETFNRQFHHVKVRVKPRGLTVRTRQGFYGVNDEAARPPQPRIPDRINQALISPFMANDITVQLSSFFANDPASGPLLHSFLFFDPRNLTFIDQPDGTHEARFDLNTIVFGDNGKIVGRQMQTVAFRVGAKRYDRALHEGVIYPFDLPIQQSGTLQFRVAILDKNSQKIGSAGQVIEVPDFKNKQLALSGIVARDEATLRARNPANATAASDENDLMIREPALRRFHQGATLNLAYEIHNAPIDQATRLPQLVTQLRLYRDGKPIYLGTPRPLDMAGQKDLQRIMANARLQLGSEMPPGEYVVQIIVQYELAKEKQRTVTQWIDFEIEK